jgi:phosphoglycolate phosphatase
LDGTLLNTMEDLAGSMNRVLESFGYPGHETEKYQ